MRDAERNEDLAFDSSVCLIITPRDTLASPIPGAKDSIPSGGVVGISVRQADVVDITLDLNCGKSLADTVVGVFLSY